MSRIALIAGGVLEYLYAHEGAHAVQAMLAEMGAKLGNDAAERIAAATGANEVTRLLAEHIDALGHEAQVADAGGQTQVEAWNCVFHALARKHPDVCSFDLAFMSAAAGRPVQRTRCMLHGAGVPIPRRAAGREEAHGLNQSCRLRESCCSAQCLVEIFDQILCILQPDRHPHQSGR